MYNIDENLLSDPIFRSAYFGARSVLESRSCEGHDAESIATDVYHDLAVEAAREPDGTPGKAAQPASTALAYRKTKFKAINNVRKKDVAQRHRDAIGNARTSTAVTATDVVIQSESKDLIQTVLFSLKFDDAVLVLARDILEMKYSEIRDFFHHVTGRMLSTRAIAYRLNVLHARLAQSFANAMPDE